MQGDINDVGTPRFYYLGYESCSIEGDIYAMGAILYPLFTGCLPQRRKETGFVVRNISAKLPANT